MRSYLGYSRIWKKNGFCLHISHKKSLFDKKRIYLQKNRICLKKKVWEKSLLRKKGFVMQKNRIYLRKKGYDKNRKKKDFFPPFRPGLSPNLKREGSVLRKKLYTTSYWRFWCFDQASFQSYVILENLQLKTVTLLRKSAINIFTTYI